MNLRDVLHGLGNPVIYYPKIAITLDSEGAAILLEYLRQNEHDDEWIKRTNAEITASTGLTSKRIAFARKVLESFDVVATRRVGMPARMEWRIDWGKFESLVGLAKPRTDSADDERPFIANEIISQRQEFEHIANGEWDHVIVTATCKDVSEQIVLNRMLDKWCSLWNKKGSHVKLTPTRIGFVRKAIKEGYKLSDFAKGIVGMTFDRWAERSNFCDWKYVHRDLTTWLELYDAKKGEALQFRPTDFNQDCDIVKHASGVFVPVDYRWDRGDDDIHKRTDVRFHPGQRRWVSRSHVDFDRLALVNGVMS